MYEISQKGKQDKPLEFGHHLARSILNGRHRSKNYKL